MNQEIKKVGRPLITTNNFQKDWKETIIALSKEGASIVEIAGELEISRNTLTALTERDELFLNTIKNCKRYCEVWWEREGRSNLKNKDFNYTGWYMNMKNRFGWADKVQQEIKQKTLDITESMSDDEINRKLKMLNERF